LENNNKRKQEIKVVLLVTNVKEIKVNTTFNDSGFNLSEVQLLKEILKIRIKENITLTFPALTYQR
jgi:hypothetical protein